MSNETNETQRASQPTEIDILRQEVGNQRANEIAEEVKNTHQIAQDLVSTLNISIRANQTKDQFEGIVDDEKVRDAGLTEIKSRLKKFKKQKNKNSAKRIEKILRDLKD